MSINTCSFSNLGISSDYNSSVTVFIANFLALSAEVDVGNLAEHI